jgi:hypothetical protein
MTRVALDSNILIYKSSEIQTWAAVNATKRPKMMPNGGRRPGETALNERARSPCTWPSVVPYFEK